jgi:hypothetical protein
MKVRSCPFCGLASEVPHETQNGCIEALQREISRVRDILDHSTLILRAQPPRPAPEDDPEFS